MKRKLTLSETDKKIFGVCGGIAEYFEIDSSFIRVAWIMASLFWGFGLIAYLACVFVIPKSKD